MAKKALDSRKAIYSFVESLLGRSLTITEHEALKELVVSYVKSNTGNLQEIVQNQATKLKTVRDSWINLLNKRATPKEVIEELTKKLEEYATTA